MGGCRFDHFQIEGVRGVEPVNAQNSFAGLQGVESMDDDIYFVAFVFHHFIDRNRVRRRG